MSVASSDQPIAIFDSGLGGLTVLKALAQKLVHENFIYLGDTARLPYGNKSISTIHRYVLQNLNYLNTLNVKAIIIACNSASTAFLQEPISSHVPIYNVIQPGALKASHICKNNKIGVIGTKATVKSKSYVKQLHLLNSNLEVFQQACPLFVPLAEEAWIDDPITNLVAYRYIQPLVTVGIDTLILGCTHYPVLRTAIRKVTGNGIELVDSAETMTEQIEADIRDHVVIPNLQHPTLRRIILQTTDDSDQSTQAAKMILGPVTFDELQHVDL